MSALDRLKQIQANFKKTWKGINCVFCGRVGTSHLLNKQRKFEVTERQIENEERQKIMLNLFTKVQEFEETRPQTHG